MREIKLTQGFVALIDDDDYERVAAHKWCVSLEGRGSKYYAIRWKVINGRPTKIRMHHFVLGIAPRSIPLAHVVDHVNANSLDNQKNNLELVTETENLKRRHVCKKPTTEPYL